VTTYTVRVVSGRTTVHISSSYRLKPESVEKILSADSVATRSWSIYPVGYECFINVHVPVHSSVTAVIIHDHFSIINYMSRPSASSFRQYIFCAFGSTQIRIIKPVYFLKIEESDRNWMNPHTDNLHGRRRVLKLVRDNERVFDVGSAYVSPFHRYLNFMSLRDTSKPFGIYKLPFTKHLCEYSK
jgi:hypothetical protein